MRGGRLGASRLCLGVCFLGDAAEGVGREDGGGGRGGAGDGAAGYFHDVRVRGVEVGLGHADLVVRQVVDDVCGPEEGVAEQYRARARGHQTP